MKTKIILFAVLLAFVGNSANAQLFDLASNKDRLTVGFQLGSAGVNTDYGGFAWGVSASLVGVYLDFLIAGPQHQNDKHVNNILWQDDEAFTINVGYQIPVLPWLRVAPIIGYCQTNYGLTDMSTVNIHIDPNALLLSAETFPRVQLRCRTLPPALQIHRVIWRIHRTFNLWWHQPESDSPGRQKVGKIKDGISFFFW